MFKEKKVKIFDVAKLKQGMIISLSGFKWGDEGELEVKDKTHNYFVDRVTEEDIVLVYGDGKTYNLNVDQIVIDGEDAKNDTDFFVRGIASYVEGINI